MGCSALENIGVADTQALSPSGHTAGSEHPKGTVRLGENTPDRRLRRRYRQALSLIGMLTVCSLILVLSELRGQKRDIPIVNTSGRQRMLSQELAKTALRLISAPDERDRSAAVRELNTSLTEFEDAQQSLESGSGRPMTPSKERDEIDARLTEVRPHFVAIDRAVQRLLETFSDFTAAGHQDGNEALPQSMHADVEKILAHESHFLDAMDELVGVYAMQTKAHSDRLLWILYGLAALFILVLLLEGIFVFEPAIRTIQRQFEEVARSGAASAENAALKVAIGTLKCEIERRKEIEEQLRKSANEVNRLLKLAGQVRHSVVVCDSDGRIQYVNEQYVRLTGYSLEELIGRKPGPLLQGPDTDPATAAAIRRHISRQEHFEAEILNYTKDGRPYWVSLEVEPVFDDAGELQCFIGTHVDVTERRANEVALEQARRAAEKASVAKSEFLARMSHEIRTPLTGILGFTELLQSREYSPEQQKVHLDIVSSCGKHLLQLIDDILDLSRIEAGKLTICRETCSPHRVIREVLSLLRVQAEQKGLALECRWTTGVPETICTDPSRLRQLLVNLVGNAIKFTECGSVTLLVAIDGDVSDPRLIIEVQDTGIGIPDEHLERIFKPFDQADTSVTRRFGGTGLGLAICRHIAESLGGEISATSQVGVGSTFRLSLNTGPLDGVPLISEGMTEACQCQVARDANGSPDLTGRRILLCDDGETNRELIGLVLRDAGATVEFAENGQQGIEAVESQGEEIDLILMDMQMPVLDGYEATRGLRRSGWKKPIIALTAHTMAGDEERCRDAGCSGFESKPVDINRLLSSVEAAICESVEAERAPSAALLNDGSTADAACDSERPIHSTLPTELRKFQAIVEKFVDRLRGQIVHMDMVLGQADCAQLAQLAHWLKGSGGTIGFDCFTEPARELERAARDRQLPAAEDALREIRGLYERIELPWRSTAVLEATG